MMSVQRGDDDRRDNGVSALLRSPTCLCRAADLLTMAAVYQPVDICDYNHLRKGWRAGIDREGKKLVIEMKMDDIDGCHTYERHTHVLYSRS